MFSIQYIDKCSSSTMRVVTTCRVVSSVRISVLSPRFRAKVTLQITQPLLSVTVTSKSHILHRQVSSCVTWLSSTRAAAISGGPCGAFVQTVVAPVAATAGVFVCDAIIFSLFLVNLMMVSQMCDMCKPSHYGCHFFFVGLTNTQPPTLPVHSHVPA